MYKEIHIGKTIKQLLLIQNITASEFAEKINCTPRNTYKIFSKPNIDTSLLLKINRALGQNLFLLYLTDDDLRQISPNHNDDVGPGNNVVDLAASAIYLNALKKNKTRHK